MHCKVGIHGYLPEKLETTPYWAPYRRLSGGGICAVVPRRRGEKWLAFADETPQISCQAVSLTIFGPPTKNEPLTAGGVLSKSGGPD